MWRVVAALALVYVAFNGIEMPRNTPSIVVPAAPDAAMQDVVKPVADIMRKADDFDRAVFAATFEEAAKLVAGEVPDTEIIFENTLGLRIFTVSVIDISWRRLAGARGKYAGLNQAVEAAFESVLSRDVKPVTQETKDAYVELCRALAWAGVSRG